MREQIAWEPERIAGDERIVGHAEILVPANGSIRVPRREHVLARRCHRRQRIWPIVLRPNPDPREIPHGRRSRRIRHLGHALTNEIVRVDLLSSVDVLGTSRDGREARQHGERNENGQSSHVRLIP